ncbi:AmmeMemoRadiSam system protein B, partial [Candidatus Woesearchaeota archaeon]|nr:AmmeMemoRadiSam system protein B [Candidatus Woesearchaeota archaeon]
MARKPIVAGQFYAGTFDALDKEINECFNSKFGPGDLPTKRKDKKILGIIAPHAGYQFSG